MPFALAAVQGCPYHDKLFFCHLLLVTLDPTPLLPLVSTHSIAWSVRPSVTYINPNTSPKELQLSSLGYFPSLQDESLVIPMHPVVTCASCRYIHSYHSCPSSGPITSRFASWLHQDVSPAKGAKHPEISQIRLMTIHCYNSFSSLFYSPDHSFLLHTYLER